MAVIEFESVSKRYYIGQRGYRSLGEDLYNLFGGLASRQDSSQAHIWALKDVSFEVNQGEVLGIIGANGAGKTTILRLLAGITRPTTGRISVKGRIGTLIELQVGFHPELTGRENIYLNGSILGMSRKEIKERFESIVDFSELRDYLDTPVKRYSSGMYVRLGFSVATYIDPDVLLIDEVLAVGDMAFRRKCLERIERLRSQARAIVFVSHNLASIEAICTKVILLSHGKVIAAGDPKEVIPIYEKLMRERATTEPGLPEKRVPTREVVQGLGEVELTNVKLSDSGGFQKDVFETGERMKVTIEYNALQKIDNPVIYAVIRHPDDFVCTGSSTRLENMPIDEIYGSGVIEIEIPELLVLPGYYIMDIIVYDKNFKLPKYYCGRRRVDFQVTSSLLSLDKRFGIFYQKQNWKVIKSQTGDKDR